MTTYRAFRIHQDKQGHRAGIEDLPKPEPAEGEVLIRISHSGVNYKDALAGTGRGKILRTFPLTGGADGAGLVEKSRDSRYREGDAVVVTGWGLTFDHDGGLRSVSVLPRRLAGTHPGGARPPHRHDPRHGRVHGGHRRAPDAR